MIQLHQHHQVNHLLYKVIMVVNHLDLAMVLRRVAAVVPVVLEKMVEHLVVGMEVMEVLELHQV